MSSLTDLFTSLANKIRSKTGSSDTLTPYEMVGAIDDVYDEGVAHGVTPTQTKSVTATTTAQTVTPDSGYALSEVTVNPQVHTETYTPTSRAAAIDMGANNNNRYLNTNSVPSEIQGCIGGYISYNSVADASSQLLAGIQFESYDGNYNVYTVSGDATKNYVGWLMDFSSHQSSSISITFQNNTVSRQLGSIVYAEFTNNTNVTLNMKITFSYLASSNTSASQKTLSNTFVVAPGHHVSLYANEFKLDGSYVNEGYMGVPAYFMLSYKEV